MEQTDSQGKTVKRYYWLKLKEEFFKDKEMKKLRRIAGGDTYTVIYLKLMLLSLKNDGKLYFDGIEETFHEELALEIDEEPENVRVTLMYLEKMKLVQTVEEDELYLTQMDNLICSESESAQRVREHRKKQKALQCNADVTPSNAIETNCNTYTDTDTNTNTHTKEKPKKTFPPTVEMVREYCESRGNGIDPQEFVDYYGAANWYRGKTKITNWKKCVNTWERKRGFTYQDDKKQTNQQMLQPEGQLQRILQ